MTDIVISHLYKAFDGKPVLSDFSVVFPAGKTTAVMGQSGVGKTTLLRILMGLESADSGTVSGMQGAKLAVVFQEDRLLEFMPPVGNIRLTAPSLSEEVIQRELEAMELGGCMAQPVRELSGGMRRRVAILRALLAEGDVLLLDEPFKGLDEETKSCVIGRTRALSQGKTVVLVTHDEREAKAMGAGIIEV